MSDWLVVWWPFLAFSPLILGMSSSQLTDSYFSEGFTPTTNQVMMGDVPPPWDPRYLPAIDSATKALALEPGNCKALYRRGLAHLRQGAPEEAKLDLLKAGMKWDEMDGKSGGKIMEK